MTDNDPATAVTRGVERALELAATWLHWDGKPLVDESGERIYTPNKAVRRYADHLIDHLAEIEAILSDSESQPDGWHGSLVTFSSDWAPFAEADLSEAKQRLRRLAQIYAIRLGGLPDEAWDAPRGSHWTIRAIVDHVAEPWYAEQVGDLSP